MPEIKTKFTKPVLIVLEFRQFSARSSSTKKFKITNFTWLKQKPTGADFYCIFWSGGQTFFLTASLLFTVLNSHFHWTIPVALSPGKCCFLVWSCLLCVWINYVIVTKSLLGLWHEYCFLVVSNQKRTNDIVTTSYLSYQCSSNLYILNHELWWYKQLLLQLINFLMWLIAFISMQ